MTRTARIEAIDCARGIAIALMILSHGVKGLLPFEDIPSWGLVPVHLITKFSSSLFFLVFGIALAVVHVPAVDTPEWPRRRRKLLIRGIVIFFWYKVLTIVEMTHLYTREDIINTLLFRAFPVYVEILGFYAIALLWIPLILPFWSRARTATRIFIPAAMVLAALWLSSGALGWTSEAVRALLVESEHHYTWGQLTRGPIVFLGLLLGGPIAAHYWNPRSRRHTAALALLVSVLLLLAFLILAVPDGLQSSLVLLAKNDGKHPPTLEFLLFSIGGAFLVLAGSLLGGERLAGWLRPITTIGKDALQAFVFHIFVLFVFYRYLLDYWHGVSYPFALFLALLLVALTSLWITALQLIRRNS